MCALVTGVQTGALPICGHGTRGVGSPRKLRGQLRDRWPLPPGGALDTGGAAPTSRRPARDRRGQPGIRRAAAQARADRYRRAAAGRGARSEEHTSELQSLMRISYAVFCLKKKQHRKRSNTKKIQLLTDNTT